MAAEEYRNLGQVTKAGSMRDVTNNSYIAGEINQNGATTIYTNNGISMSNALPKNILFKNVPKPHAAFIGRTKYIKMAIKYLTRPVTADVQIQFPCLVIHALGGYGKTQTARKIVSVCSKKRKFQHFLWIDSEDNISVRKCFVEAMKEVGLNSSDGSDATNFDSLMHQFYKLLSCRTKEKFLFIFDNIEDFDNILKFLPLNHRASNFAVLMTSQRRFTQESYGYVRNEPLDLMPEQEAIQLVERILGTSTIDSEEDTKLLVERSGRIALVLCVMASTIKSLRRSKSNYSLKDYLKEMRETPIVQHSDDSYNLDLAYNKSLKQVVRFAVEKLNAAGGPKERIAMEIFDRLAYCSSDNLLTELFVHNYFRDICEETKNVDMKLPLQLGDVQIFRLAIDRLSEFSLVQIGGDKLTVHRMVQASRRLDLKGNERSLLQKLLTIVPDMSENYENISIIWQYVASDYADLVHEFYGKKRTLMEFPISNLNLLEKIIRGLTQRADFEPLGKYSEEIEKIISSWSFNLNAVKRIVDVFNYDVRKISTKLLTEAIYITDLDAVKWLVNEKSCIPEEDNFREYFNCDDFFLLSDDLQELKELTSEIIEDSLEKNPFKRAFNKLTSLCFSPISQRIAKLEIVDLLSTLADSDPLKIRICQIIEKNCGKNVLEHILHSEPINVDHYCWANRYIKLFEIHRCMLSALEKLESSTELDDLKEKYSENSLFECLFICGGTHFHTKPDKFEVDLGLMKEFNWNDLHRAAYENNITATNSIDSRLIESRDEYGLTPLMIAAKYGACEATNMLLEHSANVNAMNNYGMTPLQYAIDKLHPSICNILLTHGAKTHWMTESGAKENELHQAVQSLADYDCPESEEIVVALLTSKDCDVCATDDDGDNVLHLLVSHYYATRYKPNHRMLHLIVSANATLVDMENGDGLTPLLLAKELQRKFTDDHWHIASLQSFITEWTKCVIRRNEVT